MALLRPFESADRLFRAAGEIWKSLDPADWLEAFAHHPKIGDIKSLRKKFATTASWAGDEQAGVSRTSEGTLKALAEGNSLYEAKFGYIFIISASGRTADEMLSALNSRLDHNPDEELKIAAGEQAKITKLRLEKLLVV